MSQDKDKMKVCIISTIRNPHIIRWVGILLSRGYHVILISSETNRSHIPGLEIIECLVRNYESYLKNMLHYMNRTIRIRRILKCVKPDVVHIHSLDYIHPLMFGLLDLVLGGFAGLMVSTWGTDIVGSHDSTPTRRGVWAKKLLLRRAKQITATSRFLADATANFAPKGKEIHVIPFGIDCNMFKREHQDTEDKTIHIGFIKHLTPKYGPDYLIKAMPMILKECPQVDLTMVGHGRMENYLKSLSVNLGIQKHVRFTGYIQYSQVPRVLAGIDVFVMPSVEDSETFGVAAIEAQAMEIPVVASKVGGVPEAVLDGETGLLVEPKNIEDLASAIIKLIKNPELRKRMGKRGRKYVLDNFNLEDNVVMMERLYQSSRSERSPVLC